MAMLPCPDRQHLNDICFGCWPRTCLVDELGQEKFIRQVRNVIAGMVGLDDPDEHDIQIVFRRRVAAQIVGHRDDLEGVRHER